MQDEKISYDAGTIAFHYVVLNYLNSAGDEEISIPDHGMVMTTFYYRYVDYQSGLLKKDN